MMGLVRMKLEIDVDVKNFEPPTSVEIELGDGSTQHLNLKALDSLTLDSLCRQFRNDVFKYADKAYPPEAGFICMNCREPEE